MGLANDIDKWKYSDVHIKEKYQATNYDGW